MSKLYSRTISIKGHKNYKISFEEYDSANDVARDCERRTRKGGGFHAPDYGEWEGVHNHEEAMELLKNGYEPVVKRMKEKVKACISGAGKRTAFHNDVQGFMPVVPLAMMGVPQSMINTYTRPIKTRVIDVYYDVTVTSAASAQQIIDNGTKVLGAIMELEAQGYKLNLYAMQTYSDDRDCDALIVKIKSSNQPFDLKRMSFPLTHSAFFRVVGFDWYGKCPTSRHRTCYGHALGYEMGDNTTEAIKQALGRNAVYISGKEILHRDETYIKEVMTNGKTENR